MYGAAYQYVTAQAGVEWNVFERALIKARAALVDLSAGTINNASKALQSLGLRVEDFDSKEAMFDGIIDALSNMEDKTLQTAYANEIFGDKIANQMLPYLNAGTDAINQFKSEFETIGALSNEQVAALAKLDDTIYLLKESLKNVCLQIGASFAPLLQRVAEIINTSLIPKLQKLAEWFNSLTIEQQAFAAKVLLVVAALAPLALGIGKVVSAIGGIIKLIPALQAGLSALAANPIILIIAVIAAILLLLYTRCEAFRDSINNLVSTLGEALQPALDAVMRVLDLVMRVLQPIKSRKTATEHTSTKYRVSDTKVFQRCLLTARETNSITFSSANTKGAGRRRACTRNRAQRYLSILLAIISVRVARQTARVISNTTS